MSGLADWAEQAEAEEPATRCGSAGIERPTPLWRHHTSNRIASHAWATTAITFQYRRGLSVDP